MATWLAVEFSGKPGELKGFIDECNKDCRRFKIASDTQNGVDELNSFIKSAGILNFSASLLSDKLIDNDSKAYV